MRLPCRPILIGVSAWSLGCGEADGVGGGFTTAPAGTSSDGSGSSSSSGGESSSTAIADSSSSVAPAMLVVECGEVPPAAVGATFSFTPMLSGDHGSALWSTEALPAGLVSAQIGGTIYGTPEAAGSYDVAITASEDGASASATCTIVVGPALSIDLDALGKPCLEPGDDPSALVVGGDGSPLSCSVPPGSGNGIIAPGLAVDPDTCMVTGTIDAADGDNYGTWAWMTRIEQAGVKTWVPYCATQAEPPMPGYVIDGDHSGQVGNILDPAVGTFAPGEPIAWAGGGAAVVRVTGPCGSNSCYHGVLLSIAGSPFDDVSLDPITTLHDVSDAPIGLAHEFSASGPPVAAGFEARPWVQSWFVRYCIAPDAVTCADGTAIDANGQGSLRFATIMRPQ